jgi:hypothetical protein
MIRTCDQSRSTFKRSDEQSVVDACAAVNAVCINWDGPATTDRAIKCRHASKYLVPLFSTDLAWAYVQLGRYDDASHGIDEVITTLGITQERWFEAEANRVAGEIALRLPTADAAKAQAYFEQALAVARQQQAKSWELRGAMKPRTHVYKEWQRALQLR